VEPEQLKAVGPEKVRTKQQATRQQSGPTKHARPVQPAGQAASAHRYYWFTTGEKLPESRSKLAAKRYWAGSWTVARPGEQRCYRRAGPVVPATGTGQANARLLHSLFSFPSWLPFFASFFISLTHETIPGCRPLSATVLLP
jgi:hypothetical protein